MIYRLKWLTPKSLSLKLPPKFSQVITTKGDPSADKIKEILENHVFMTRRRKEKYIGLKTDGALTITGFKVART